MSQPIEHNLSDKYLIAKVLGGDTQAFSIIINHTEALVAQIVCRMVDHAQDRQDIAKDVYLKAFKGLGGFKMQSRLSTWIARIAYNTCLSHLEKRKPLLSPVCKTLISISNEELKYAGTIRFNEDESGIDSISRDGYFSYEKNGHRLEAGPDPAGGVRYVLYENGRTQTFDEGGKTFLLEAIDELIAYCYDATDRAAREYNKRGAKAMIGEVGQMKNDNLKNIYFDYILRSDSLTQDDWIRVIAEAGHVVPDQEKSELLVRISKKMPEDDKITATYLAIARTIGSDDQYGKAVRAIGTSR